MKAKGFLMKSVLFLVVPLLLITGCKYNVTEPLWDQPYTPPPVPKISSINPSAAVAGVNTITIQGENLIVGTGTTLVYFDQSQADVLSSSATSITVRRPNVATDSSTVKIIPHDAIEEAIYKPYKVSAVMEKYGSFLQNVPLSMVAVDNAGNIYVAEQLSKAIHKATPDGVNTVIGTATYSPTDGKIGPDGNLYLTEKNRAVDKVDLTAGTVSRWTRLPSGKVVEFCDFGDNGYFYSGGSRTDLLILPFDLSASATTSGFYANDDIQAIRFFNGYIYVASITSRSQEPTKIWRDKVNADGSVGDRELVFDLASIADSSTVSGIGFAQNGTMYITTNSSSDPLISVDLSSKTSDVFYKGILRPYCDAFAWGSDNYLYMINGNTDAAETWTVYRVDMGTNGVPYY